LHNETPNNNQQEDDLFENLPRRGLERIEETPKEMEDDNYRRSVAELHR